MRTLAGTFAVPIIIIASLILAGLLGGRSAGDQFLFLVVSAWILGMAGLAAIASFTAWLMYLFPAYRKTKPIRYCYKSLAVQRAEQEGCGRGTPYTFFFKDFGRMFRKFIGLVEVPGRS